MGPSPLLGSGSGSGLSFDEPEPPTSLVLTNRADKPLDPFDIPTHRRSNTVDCKHCNLISDCVAGARFVDQKLDNIIIDSLQY